MRRGPACSLAVRLSRAEETLSSFLTAFQVNESPAFCDAKVALFTTVKLAGAQPQHAPYTRTPAQSHCFAERSSFNRVRGFSASALSSQSQSPGYFSGEEDGFGPDDEGLDAVDDLERSVPHLESVSDAAHFVKQNLHSLTAVEVGDVMQQVVEMHFQKISGGGKRAEYIPDALDLLHLILQRGSPLLDNGEAIAHALWGASKLRLRPTQADREALMAPLERDMHKLSPNGLAAVLWGIGQLRIPPSPEFWDLVTDRLFGEGQCSYLKMYELVPAISGICSLPEYARQTPLPEYMMREVVKVLPLVQHIKAGGAISPRDLSTMADFLPIIPQSPARDELLQQVFQNARRLAPRLEHVAVVNIFWAAARLRQEGSIDEPTAQALLQRARATLRYNKGHAVPDLLWSLGRLGYRKNDGIVSEDFVHDCMESQRFAMKKDVSPAKVLKLLTACNLLGVPLSEDDLALCLDHVVRQDFKRIDGLGMGALAQAFQRLNYQPGIEACQAKRGGKGGRAGGKGAVL